MTATAFDNLDDYLALPRVAGLAVSADGSRVVTTVAELNDKRTDYVSAIWEVDPSGEEPARRLTRGSNGDSAPAFTVDGDLLFVSSRRTAENTDGADKPPASLWRIPAGGGEAIEVLSMPGGVSLVRTARRADATVIGTPFLASARDVEDDRRLRGLRKANNVTAILHSGYPVRFWDQDIGPDEPHLFDATNLRDLTPQPGEALREAGFDDATFDISADGQFLVTTWRVTGPEATERSVLLRVDLASGERRVIADDPDAELQRPAISPDGSAIAFSRETISTPDCAPRMTLQYLRFGDQPRPLAEVWDRRPTSLTWSNDGASLIVTADQNGRAPIFAVEVATSAVTQLTDDDYAYTDVVAAPGGVLFALYPFFLPVHILSRVFRGKFVASLKRRFQQHQLTFAGSLKPLENQKAFRSFLRPLFRENWVVYAKPPFGGPHHVLGYLARYTHRVAITNHRLVAFENDQVTFRWKDYAHGNKKRTMPLGSQQFLRRFLLHVLPRGFVRIRSFGFLATRSRARLLPLCRRLLADFPTAHTPAAITSSPTQPTCFPLPKMFHSHAYRRKILCHSCLATLDQERVP